MAGVGITRPAQDVAVAGAVRGQVAGLPATGFDVTVGAFAVVVLLAGGAAMLMAARRRKAGQAS